MFHAPKAQATHHGALIAAMIVMGSVVMGLAGPASAQELPESSLGALFPVTDPVMVELAGGGSVDAWTRPSPRRARPDTLAADDDVDVGPVILLSALGTVVGDIGGVILALGCRINCENDGDASLALVGGAALAVGTPAGGAILGGGDAMGAFLGSALGLASGLLLAHWNDGHPAALMVPHVTMTALGALRKHW